MRFYPYWLHPLVSELVTLLLDLSVPIWIVEGMDLKDYMREHRLTDQAFATLVGVHRLTIFRYRHHLRVPRTLVI